MVIVSAFMPIEGPAAKEKNEQTDLHITSQQPTYKREYTSTLEIITLKGIMTKTEHTSMIETTIITEFKTTTTPETTTTLPLTSKPETTPLTEPTTVTMPTNIPDL